MPVYGVDASPVIAQFNDTNPITGGLANLAAALFQGPLMRAQMEQQREQSGVEQMFRNRQLEQGDRRIGIDEQQLALARDAESRQSRAATNKMIMDWVGKLFGGGTKTAMDRYEKVRHSEFDPSVVRDRVTNQLGTVDPVRGFVPIGQGGAPAAPTAPVTNAPVGAVFNEIIRGIFGDGTQAPTAPQAPTDNFNRPIRNPILDFTGKGGKPVTRESRP